MDVATSLGMEMDMDTDGYIRIQIQIFFPQTWIWVRIVSNVLDIDMHAISILNIQLLISGID